jgi:putative intracellular protease/amidase/predicted ester cyclase
MKYNSPIKFFVMLVLSLNALAAAPAVPSQPGRVLIVTTSHAVLGKTGYPTGFWLPELTHPYFELVHAGFEVEIASLKGGRPPIDPYSDPANPGGVNKDDMISVGFLGSAQHVAKLNGSLKLSTVDPVRYVAVVFAGGNGAVFDMRDDPDVKRIAAAIWSKGGVVASLCHGTAALLDVKLADGSYLIAGHEVTGFTNQEEAIAQKQIGAEYLPFYLQDEIGKRGGLFKEAPPFTPSVAVSRGGRLITGQQNFSGLLLGKQLVAQLAGGAQAVNASVARRFFEELWNQRKLAVADEIIAPDSVSSSLISGVPVAATKHPRTPADMKVHAQEWWTAFPDLTFAVESIVADGEGAMVYFRAQGTHKGVWYGLPATGRKADIKGVIVQRMVNGRIVEDWVMVDLLGVIQQLGLVPPLPDLIAQHVAQTGNKTVPAVK